MTQNDKAGKDYWNETWSKGEFPKLFDPKNQSLDNYVNLELHNYFKKILGNKKGFSVLEIGCANSIWPVYFHQEFNAEVYGLDYSEVGCRRSRALLEYYKVPGKIYCSDLFAPSEDLIGKFDLVVSFGVVEHFENTAQCLKSCAAFVKPGGKLLTLIPNMSGIVGLIQKYVDRLVYDVHVPLTKKQFIMEHQKADLSLENCDYFMSINLNAANSGSFAGHAFNTYLRHLLSGTSKIFWMLEKQGLTFPKNGVTSPYLIAVAKQCI